MIISTKCIDLLLCTFKIGHLLLIMMVTDCINLTIKEKKFEVWKKSVHLKNKTKLKAYAF